MLAHGGADAGAGGKDVVGDPHFAIEGFAIDFGTDLILEFEVDDGDFGFEAAVGDELFGGGRGGVGLSVLLDLFDGGHGDEHGDESDEGESGHYGGVSSSGHLVSLFFVSCGLLRPRRSLWP